MLQALDRRGGTLTRAALAVEIAVPEMRLPGLVAGLRRLLKDDELALEAYNEAYERSGSPNGWLSLSSTLGSASILHQQGNTEAAQKVMARYDGMQLLEMPAVWGDRLRALNEQIAEKLSGALLIIANSWFLMMRSGIG